MRNYDDADVPSCNLPNEYFFLPLSRQGGYVARYIAEHSIDQVFTFDDGGVSGHCNHADVARGVKWVLTKGAAGSGSAGTNCLVSPITNRKKGKTQPTQSASAAGGGGGGGGGSGGAQRSTVTESCTGGTEVEQHRPPVPSTVRGYSLRTTSVCKKYLGVIDAAWYGRVPDPNPKPLTLNPMPNPNPKCLMLHGTGGYGIHTA